MDINEEKIKSCCRDFNWILGHWCVNTHNIYALLYWHIPLPRLVKLIDSSYTVVLPPLAYHFEFPCIYFPSPPPVEQPCRLKKSPGTVACLALIYLALIASCWKWHFMNPHWHPSTWNQWDSGALCDIIRFDVQNYVHCRCTGWIFLIADRTTTQIAWKCGKWNVASNGTFFFVQSHWGVWWYLKIFL